MTRREQLVNAHLAHRIRRIRQEHGKSRNEIARRVGLSTTACQKREAALLPLGMDFLLRFQLTLGLDIRDIWFPVSEAVPYVDDNVIRELLEGIARQHRAPTEADVLAIAAEVFGLPERALRSGGHQKVLVQARTAAAFAVESHPLLQLAALARLTKRTPEGLHSARVRASAYGPDFWRKVELVRREVDEL